MNTIEGACLIATMVHYTPEGEGSFLETESGIEPHETSGA